MKSFSSSFLTSAFKPNYYFQISILRIWLLCVIIFSDAYTYFHTSRRLVIYVSAIVVRFFINIHIFSTIVIILSRTEERISHTQLLLCSLFSYFGTMVVISFFLRSWESGKKFCTNLTFFIKLYLRTLNYLLLSMG